jgi:DNA-binding response OmpR family regulator
MVGNILVVDDDVLICKGLKFNLEKAGYSVITATNGHAALDHVNRQNIQAVILDIGLPGEDGLSLCRHLKEVHHLPVLFLTARRRELDEIIGLEIGADDYITKPFNVDVLLAHLKAVLRRAANPELHDRQALTSLSVGDFSIDRAPHQAFHRGELLNLSPREFDLLFFFLSHPEHVYSAEEIIDGEWGSEFIGEPQVLYVQIRSLRVKIEDDPSNPRHLLTLRGTGYKFVP